MDTQLLTPVGTMEFQGDPDFPDCSIHRILRPFLTYLLLCPLMRLKTT